MSSEKEKQEDWFARAESFLADWKDREAGRGETFTPEAWRVLRLTTPLALKLGHKAVGAEHLLAGVLKVNSGKGAVALRQAGLTLVGLREDIEAELGLSEEDKVNRRIPYTPRCKGIVERATARVRSVRDARVDV